MLLLLLSRFSRVQLCATPQTAAHQASPSLGFSRQEHWSGLPFLLHEPLTISSLTAGTVLVHPGVPSASITCTCNIAERRVRVHQVLHPGPGNLSVSLKFSQGLSAKFLHIRRCLRAVFLHTRTSMQRTSLHSPSAPLPHSQQHFQVDRKSVV